MQNSLLDDHMDKHLNTATTAMQAVLLYKRASKLSDPLDRDPTVSHI
jgi:hypothetical protein